MTVFHFPLFETGSKIRKETKFPDFFFAFDSCDQRTSMNTNLSTKEKNFFRGNFTVCYFYLQQKNVWLGIFS